MKQYDIAWLAEEAGLQMAYPVNHPIAKFIVAIEARAAAKEREACADMVFRYIAQTTDMEARGCLASVTHDIRARGEA